ncbi:hypothetical protein MKK67_02385 [Methylobacterium sp. J-072]|uniref:hypothetical protein n=1 Tax=Methylobacterium sp. J-072 TaxID=2836651 RepID=UPI001FB87517|nr:hypothetical protein [Methylobacterium sp. J-072]MCJ2091362.1 hypothetical protein [Methylobacterium sp. J-072]
MTSYIVTEGPADAIVLRALLHEAGREDIRVLEAGGKSSAVSLGTSLALNDDNRVAIVVDADTTDPDRVLEQQDIFQDLQRDTSGDEACRLFVAVPTLEEDLFKDVEHFSSVFDLKLGGERVENGRKDWGSALKRLLPKPHARPSEQDAIPKVRADAAEQVIDHRLIRELISFLPMPTARPVP